MIRRPSYAVCLAATIGALGVASCVSPYAPVDMRSEAVGSANFSLSRPTVYRLPGGVEIEGRACRVAGSTRLSPARVRLEHVRDGEDTLEIAHADIPPIYLRGGDACANFVVRVDWRIEAGDGVRACFDRGRPCSTQP